MTIAQALHDAVAAVCPILGVAIGDQADKTTWRIAYDPSASDAQKTAAQAALAAFNPAFATLQDAALAALAASDLAMHRIAEAVSLGANSWTGADVVAFVDYRRALRAIADGTNSAATALPAKPVYPAGT